MYRNWVKFEERSFSMSPPGAVLCDDSLNMQSFTLLFPVNNILMHREEIHLKWKQSAIFVAKPKNWDRAIMSM